MPDAVIKEVMAEGVYDCACKTLLSHDWLRRAEDSPIEPYVASWDLGFGESSVLSFALKNPEYWAIIDDLEALRCAMSLKCRYTGTVG
ncbi:MAG: DUF3368 domain-containing protein, partial [Proteobacteria bacterium]|nr:DUF3368 domain-containing protein [Pseudomonadota bacterium]